MCNLILTPDQNGNYHLRATPKKKSFFSKLLDTVTWWFVWAICGGIAVFILYVIYSVG